MNKGKKGTAAYKADRALRIARTLQLQQEKKFAITSLSSSIDNVGHTFMVNDMDQGLGDSQRVGDRITVESIRLNLWRVIPGSASGRFSLRVLVILDKQNSITDVSEIFFGTSSNYSPFLQFVKDRRPRFSVLYDSGPNHMDQYNKGDTLTWERKLNTRVQFDAASTTILTGAIKLVAISNQGTSSSNRPILIGTVRVNYTDA